MANTFKGLLPDGRLPSAAVQHVQDLVGDTSAGGFYIDEDGVQVPYVMVASVEEPEPTIVIDGRTFEVWWVQLDPPDPAAWMPKPVTKAEGARAFVVPVDAGAMYTVDGVIRAAGTHAVPGMEETSVVWSAAPRSGYSFAPGAVTSGTLEFPARTYQPGDVVFSDSFAREGALAGSQTDSFEGGDPLTWGSLNTTGSMNRTAAGVLQGVRSTDVPAAFDMSEVVFPASFTSVDVVFKAAVVDASQSPSNSSDGLYLVDGNTILIKIDIGGGGGLVEFPSRTVIPGAPQTTIGDLIRLEVRPGVMPKFHNLTKGTASNYTGTFVPDVRPFDRVRVDLRPKNYSPIGTVTYAGFDSVKVVAQ